VPDGNIQVKVFFRVHPTVLSAARKILQQIIQHKSGTGDLALAAGGPGGGRNEQPAARGREL
jgi:hypothetical protein